MEVVEMLDNLKEKARRDRRFGRFCWLPVRRRSRWLPSVKSAGSLGFQFMRWI